MLLSPTRLTTILNELERYFFDTTMKKKTNVGYSKKDLPLWLEADQDLDIVIIDVLSLILNRIERKRNLLAKKKYFYIKHIHHNGNIY